MGWTTQEVQKAEGLGRFATFTLSSSPSSGDLICWAVQTNATGSNTVDAVGFTNLVDSVEPSTETCTYSVGYKKSDGTEGTTITVDTNGGGSDPHGGYIVVAAPDSGDFGEDAAPTNFAGDGSSDAVITVPAITVGSGETFAIAIGGMDNRTNSTSSSVSASNGYTSADGGSVNQVMVGAVRAFSASGSTGSVDLTLSSPAVTDNSFGSHLSFVELSASTDANVNASGQAATVLQGSASVSAENSNGVAATGQALTAWQGAVTVSSTAAASVPATGQFLTASQGAASVVTDQEGIVAATGQFLTVSQGAVSTNISVGAAATGQGLTLSQGAAEISSDSISTVDANGQAISASQGSASIEGESFIPANVAAVGQVLTTSKGSPAISTDGFVSVNATGQSLFAVKGSPTVSVTAFPSINATGQGLSAGQGNANVFQVNAAIGAIRFSPIKQVGPRFGPMKVINT